MTLRNRKFLRRFTGVADVMAGEPVTSVDGTVDTHVRPGMLDKPGTPDKLGGQADAEHTPQEINDVLLVTPARNKRAGFMWQAQKLDRVSQYSEHPKMTLVH